MVPSLANRIPGPALSGVAAFPMRQRVGAASLLPPVAGGVPTFRDTGERGITSFHTPENISGE